MKTLKKKDKTIVKVESHQGYIKIQRFTLGENSRNQENKEIDLEHK